MAGTVARGHFGFPVLLAVLIAAVGCSNGGPAPGPSPEATRIPAESRAEAEAGDAPAAECAPLDVEGCLADQLPKEDPVREPSGLGSWFPSSRDGLLREVNGFLSAARTAATAGDPVALIAPHAGYAFCGPVAAEAYRRIAGKPYETVIIVGPCHQYPLDGISVETEGSYGTPLGTVPIDSGIAKALISDKDGRIRRIPEAHAKEHSIQNHVPLLQCVLRKFRIVPVLINAADPDDYSILARALHAAVAGSGKKVLLVASTDLSHFPSAKDAATADREITDAFRTMDEKYILDRNNALLKRRIPGLSCAACGIDAVIPVVMAAKMLGANKLDILDLRNSFDVARKDASRVVGYTACIICKVASEGIDLESRKKLLEIARKTLEAVLGGKQVPQFDVKEPELLKHGGAFVTLKNQGELRGCIGKYPEEGGKTPLWKVVSEMAVASALHDYRFEGEHPDLKELEDIDIEISVLSIPRRVKSADDVVLGKHGVIVKKGFRQGTYLPQVALETGWTKEQFLSSLCSSKAGLQSDAWKNDPAAEIWIYDADVFHE